MPALSSTTSIDDLRVILQSSPDSEALKQALAGLDPGEREAWEEVAEQVAQWPDDQRVPVAVSFPRAILPRGAFWKIIDDVKESSKNVKDTLAKLEEQISGESTDRALAFGAWVDAYAEALKVREDLKVAAETTCKAPQENQFNDFSGWLIANGQEVFDNVAKDPEFLATLSWPRGSRSAVYADGATLFEIAKSAHEAASGLRDGLQSPKILDQDTWGEDKLNSEAWDDVDVLEKLPKIAERFWKRTHQNKMRTQLKKRLEERKKKADRLALHQSRIDASDSPSRPYNIRETYTEGDVIEHKKFGTGVVEKIFNDRKIEVFFHEEHRVLVHAR